MAIWFIVQWINLLLCILSFFFTWRVLNLIRLDQGSWPLCLLGPDLQIPDKILNPSDVCFIEVPRQDGHSMVCAYSATLWCISKMVWSSKSVQWGGVIQNIREMSQHIEFGPSTGATLIHVLGWTPSGTTTSLYLFLMLSVGVAETLWSITFLSSS